MHLHGDCVGEAKLGTPVTAAYRNESQLSCDYSTTNSSGHLLGALCTKPNVAIGVADQDIDHEAIGLPGRRHLLHGVDLHDLIFQGARSEVVINDLSFFDRK